VRLGVLNRRWLEARVGEAGAKHLFLRDDRGNGHPTDAPVLVDARPDQHGVDAIAVGERSVERLEQDEAAAFASDVAVRARVECMAAAVGRDHRGLAEADRDFGSEIQLRSAREREVALAVAERAHCEVDRGQRRGAGRVHDEARTAQVEHVRDAVCGDAGCTTGHRMGIDQVPVEGIHLHRAVVVRREPDEDSGARARHLVGREPRVLDRLVGDLE
jgi:hypothetical protein